jgi:hypothetical protein
MKWYVFLWERHLAAMIVAGAYSAIAAPAEDGWIGYEGRESPPHGGTSLPNIPFNFCLKTGMV